MRVTTSSAAANAVRPKPSSSGRAPRTSPGRPSACPTHGLAPNSRRWPRRRPAASAPRPRVPEPANLVRLRRAYTWARAAAGSLAAVFVLLVGGAFYLDATAPSTGGVLTPPAQPTVAAQQAAPPTSPPPAPAAARAAQ